VKTAKKNDEKKAAEGGVAKISKSIALAMPKKKAGEERKREIKKMKA